MSSHRKMVWAMAVILFVATVMSIPLASRLSFAQDAPQTGATENETTQQEEIFLPFIFNQGGQIDLGDIFAQDHPLMGHTHQNDRFTGVGVVWPPQPKGIEDIDILPADEQSLRSAALSQAEEVALRAPEVLQALGNRYVFLGSESLVRKGDENNRSFQNTYFSHANNKTVMVTLNAASVEEVTTIAPRDYQPPLNEQEVVDAIAIARAAFDADGIERVSELEGFGILALPITEMSTFFDERMVYVSFHANENDFPELVAWVDLTTQVVTASREE